MKTLIEKLFGSKVNENAKKISVVESSVQRLNDSVDQLKFEMRTSHVIDTQVQKSNAQWQDKAGAALPKTDGQNKPSGKGPGPGRSNKEQSTRPKNNTWDRVSEEPGLTEADQPSGAPRGGSRRSDTPDTRNSKLVEKFVGRVGTWENWFHKFQFTAKLCKWNNDDMLFMLTNALTGPALTAHSNLPESVILDYDSLVAALKEKVRFGKTDPATQSILRAELKDIKQTEGEDLETFADRVYAHCLDAHPAQTLPGQLQMYATEAFMDGILDKNSAWLASNIANPKHIIEAVNQVKLAKQRGDAWG